jgi:hypothetical protein
MPCPKKDQLMADYRAAVDSVSAAAEAQGSPEPGTSEWRDATQKARLNCEKALAALNLHRAEHGC